MCSRYFLDADGNIIAYTFRVPPNPSIRKRFNIAPTQLAPVIRAPRGADGAAGAREVAMLRWGLVPFWAKDLKVGTSMINARSEGVESKPAFREAIRQRRCVVPATGFFEWQGEPGRKQPFAITLPGHEIIAFAGLWERWKPADGEPVETFTIVTTDANDAVAEIHDRMPLTISRDDWDRWLDPDAPIDEGLLRGHGDLDRIEIREVSRLVNSIRNNGPELIEPAKPEPEQATLL